MNRALGMFLVIVLGLAAAAYLGSPFWAFQQLKEAAQTGDKDRLAALVDFPAVREDLKRQVDSGAVKLAREASGVGFPAVMALGRLGSLLGDRTIDRLVTPQAIATMVTLGRSPRDPTARTEAADVQSGKVAPQPSVHYGYLSPDRFRVALSPNAQSDVAAALIMQRQGLFSWRVEQIELPRYERR